MKKLLFSLSLAGFFLGGNAQELPQPSPQSTLQQRVGLTDITINYSRPSARGREIFGGLVPYGEMWRTGANKATSIIFSTPVTFGGERVDAGEYSLFTIPEQDGGWTIILNHETELWGTGKYNDDRDAARVEVTPTPIEYIETFTIDIADLSNESALLTLAWAETKVMIPIEVRTMETAKNNIEVALEESAEEDMWRVFRNAANFYYNNKLNMSKALEYINASLAENRDNWYSHYLRAEILAEQEEYDGAIESANMALKMGMAANEDEPGSFNYADNIEESIEKWSDQ